MDEVQAAKVVPMVARVEAASLGVAELLAEELAVSTVVIQAQAGRRAVRRERWILRQAVAAG